MNKIEIVRLNELETVYVDQASKLLIDNFYFMFQSISKNKNILHRLFTPCIQKDSVYVQLDGDKIAAVLAFSNSERRAIVIDKAVCISVFGRGKGTILAWQLNKILSTPAVKDSQSCYLDFLATDAEYRRMGLASKLMSHVENVTVFQNYYLDVLVSNTPAISLYEKQGFRKEKLKKGILEKMAGIKPMYIMKKTIER